MIRLLLLIFLFLSCTYIPSGENFQEIQTTDIPLPSFDLTDIDSDTINASPNRNFEFDFTNEYRKIYSVDVYFNNSYIRTIHSGKSNFQITTRDLITGHYKLELIIIFSSGTQSLADQAGEEIQSTKKSWTLAVDNDPATPVNITNTYFDEESKAMVVEWEKYTRANFGKYIIEGRESFSLGGRNYFSHSIENQNTTSFKLPEYSGNEIELRITVVASTSTDYVSGNSVKLKDSRIGFLSSSLIENRDLKVTWSRSKYDYSFGSYDIHLTAGRGQGGVNITDINDTSYIFSNVPQGDQAFFSFDILSKSNKIILTKDSLIDVNSERIPFTSEGDLGVALYYYSNGYFYLGNPKNNLLEIFSEESNSVIQRQGPGRITFAKDYVIVYNTPTSVFSATDMNNINDRRFVSNDSRYIRSITSFSGNVILITRYNSDQTTEDTFMNLETMEYISSPEINYPKYVYRSDNKIWDTETGESKYSTPKKYRTNSLMISKDLTMVGLVSVDVVGGQYDNLDTKTYFRLFSTPDFNLVLEKKFDGDHRLIHVNKSFTKFLFYYPHRLVIIDRTGTVLQQISIRPGTYLYKDGKVINGKGYLIDVDI